MLAARSCRPGAAGAPQLLPVARRQLTAAGHRQLQLLATTRSQLLARPEADQRDGEALDVHGGRDVAHANVVGPVVAEGVGQVVEEVGQGALAGGLRLQGEACGSWVGCVGVCGCWARPAP